MANTVTAFLSGIGAEAVAVKHIPGMWAVEYVLAGSLHRHGFAGGIPASAALGVLEDMHK